MAEPKVSAFLQDLSEKVATTANHLEETTPQQMATMTAMKKLWITILSTLPAVHYAENNIRNEKAVSSWLSDLMETASMANTILERLTPKVPLCMPTTCSVQVSSPTRKIIHIANKFESISMKGSAILCDYKVRISNSIFCDKDDDDLKILSHILDCLQPHPDLKILIISDNLAPNFRSWFENQWFSNLERIVITRCFNLESIFDLRLRHLVSLKSLSLDECKSLKWPETGEACLPPSLEHLKIINCHVISNNIFFVELQSLISLCTLHIEDQDLESLPAELLRHLTALTELTIMDCMFLSVLGFEALPSLQSLKIGRCYNLRAPPPIQCSFPPSPLEYLELDRCSLGFLSGEVLQKLTSLKRLYIDRCSSDCFPDEWGSLTSLEELSIVDSDIMSLPAKGFPSSLMILIINVRRMSIKDSEVYAPDWQQKIAHIAYVEINWTRINTEAWKKLEITG